MEQNNKPKQDNKIVRAKIEVSQSPDYDFSCIASPSANGQINYSYENDEYFNQVLRTGQSNIKTDRMESGLPIFDNHPWKKDAMSTLGISVGYEFTERGIKLLCKFGARADEALRSDVKNGIIKTVSIEGDIYNYTIERKAGEIPTYYAELWEPTSVSFAPVPQDIESQIEVKRSINEQIAKSKTIESTEEVVSNYELLINKF